MKNIGFSVCYILLMTSFLFGCGGGTVKSADKIVVETPNEQKLIGYWTPKNPANESYEFFASSINGPTDTILKTGRILRNGSVSYLFYWNLQSDGTINISVVSSNCQARPVDVCQTISNRAIVASGSSAQDSKWTITGTTNGTVVDIYHQQGINLSKLSQGDFFLSRADTFDIPLKGTVKDNTISIRMDGFEFPIVISASMPASEVQSIDFPDSENLAITSTQEFYVTGIGYQTFSIKQWYKNVRLNAIANGNYSLFYVLHSEVQVPNGINSDLINLGYFLKDRTMTSVATLIDGFVFGPTIQASDTFYSYFPIDFILGGDRDNNEIAFISNAKGILRHTDLFGGARSKEYQFSWVQQSDGTTVCSVPNYGNFTLKFLRPIIGGFRVLISKPDPKLGTAYIIHDFLKDDQPTINEADFPGRFEFTSSNQWGKQEITFHKDKTVTSNPNLVGGFWFQDFNGDIVSYECTDLLGFPLKNYGDCYSSFNDISKVSFAHLRRLHFLNKTGNTYKIKYDASFYGERFGALGDRYEMVGWTYSWNRIGNEPQ